MFINTDEGSNSRQFDEEVHRATTPGSIDSRASLRKGEAHALRIEHRLDKYHERAPEMSARILLRRRAPHATVVPYHILSLTPSLTLFGTLRRGIKSLRRAAAPCVKVAQPLTFTSFSHFFRVAGPKTLETSSNL